MKRLLALTLCLFGLPRLALAGSGCDQFVVPYNTVSTISFCLKTYSSSATNDNEKLRLKTDATFAAGDIKINLDHAGEANIGTLPTDRGACYDFPLSTGETTGKEGYIAIVDQTTPAIWTDHCIEYRTMGNASAFYASPVAANVTQWSSSNVAAVDTAGYPKVTVKSGTGTGEISISSGVVSSNITKIDGTSTSSVAELSSCPSSSPGLLTMIQMGYEVAVHKMTSTSNTQTLFKRNGSSALCSSSLTDDGSQFTRDLFQ